MSKDPLEELFGPLEPDEAVTQAFPEPDVTPAPMPARPVQQPATQQYAQDPITEPVPELKKRSSAALPWLIVAGVVVVALAIALVFVNMMSGGGSDPKPTDETSETPSVDPSTDAPSEEPSAEPEEPAATEPPTVDVGSTFPMDISYAGISVVTPTKLDPAEWYVPGTGDEVMFHSTLMGTFPASCADMRSVVGKSPWGIQREADGKWTVIRPETSCAEAPELYGEVWGLMQSIADSAKPLEAATTEPEADAAQTPEGDNAEQGSAE